MFAKWPKKIHRAGGPNSLWDRKTPIEKRGRWEVVDESEPYLVKTAGARSCWPTIRRS